VAGRRAMALVDAAEASRQAGLLAESRAAFTEAAAVAAEEEDGQALALAALGVGGIWVYEQRDFLQRAALEALWRRARMSVPEGSLIAARLDVRTAAEAVYEGGPVAAVERAVEIVIAFGDDAASAEALSLLHHVQLGPSRARSRLGMAEEIVRLAASADNPLLGLMGLCWRTVDLFLVGDPHAEQSHQELRERSEAAGCEAIAFVADVVTATCLARRGRLADAEVTAASALERGKAAGDPDAPAYFGAMLAALRWWQGRAAEIIDLVRAASASPRLGPNDHVYVAADAVLYSDGGGKRAAARVPIHGRDRIASFFEGLARAGNLPPPEAVHRIRLGGLPGIVVVDQNGAIDTIMTADIRDGRIATIYAVRNPDKLAHVSLSAFRKEGGTH